MDPDPFTEKVSNSGLCDECNDKVGQWVDFLLACLTLMILTWAAAEMFGWFA
jgi:hypothetical protein